MSIPIETIMEQSAVNSVSAVDDEQSLTDSGFYWRARDGVKVLISRALEEKGFVNGFSTRLGGVSPFPKNDLNLAGFNEDSADNIYENRRRFLAVFSGDLQLALAWQVHGDEVRFVREPGDAGDSNEHADAVASDLGGVLAGVKTADCVPVIVGDPVTRAYAAIHAGWRGTVQSIVKKTVEKLGKAYGALPMNLIAAIGPAAGCGNYEIGTDVIDAFAANFADSERYFTPTHDGHALVDLHAANRDQLIDAGVKKENIYIAPFCTMERPDLFFSYRLEKRKFGKTGRLMSVVGRR